MAKMYPDVFPRKVDPSHPEYIVYTALKSLPANYHIFYSKKIIDNRLHDREADFIILNTQGFLILLEVKGGNLEYDGQQNRWNQNGLPMSEGPDTQALRALYMLLHRPGIEAHADSIRCGWALCFPNCTIKPGQKWPVGLTPEQIIDATSLEKIAKQISEIESRLLLGYSKEPSKSSISSVLSRLSTGLGFINALGVRIAREAEQIKEVTEEQFDALQDAELNPRLLISGPAGSGKTLLAQELARRFAATGKNVLLMAFNKAITREMRDAFFQSRYSKGETGGKVTVTTFHSFAKRQVETVFPGWFEKQEHDDRFWEEILPAKLLDIPAAKLPKYDALVVDEGQDFTPEWFELLSLLTTESANFVVFLDEHQDIFGHWKGFPVKPVPMKKRLTRNCRNTIRIIDYLESTAKVGMRSFPSSPEGSAVVIKEFSDVHAEGLFIKEEIQKLISSGIKPHELIVLINELIGESPLRGIDLKGYSIQYYMSGRENIPAGYKEKIIHYSTINTFKGLEREIVFVSLGEMQDPNEVAKAIYTQGSRARHILYILKRKISSVS